MPTLEQLDTPYERRRVIEYGVDGNKVVRHWHDVQHIAGPLYKSKEEKNKYGEQEMDLYLFFEGGKDGLLYQYSMRHLEQYTPEKMMEEIERVGYDTLEHFLTTFDQSVVEGKFIGAAVIEFVRQFDTERGNRYAQHRLDYIARQEEKHRRLAAERAEKAAQKEAQRKAAEQAARAKYLGWADQMTAMRFGKVSSVLDVLIRVDGKVILRMLCEYAVLKGHHPSLERYRHALEAPEKEKIFQETAQALQAAYDLLQSEDQAHPLTAQSEAARAYRLTARKLQDRQYTALARLCSECSG